jgi:DAK2 domain fusion protein YloV
MSELRSPRGEVRAVPGLQKALLAFADAARDALAAAREEVDALNIFPVPDGDTGTNMMLTFEAARSAMRDSFEEATDVGAGLAGFARGALLGARGNSGVIFSELVGALVKHLLGCGGLDTEHGRATALAEAMVSATEAGYVAVGNPVEGTILSVARAASEAAVRAARDDQASVGGVVAASAAAARRAVEATPGQLQVLREAGVVDAGGLALCVVLDAADGVFNGRRRVPVRAGLGDRKIALAAASRASRAPGAQPERASTGGAARHGPGYEVMFLLDAADDDLPPLKAALAQLGDSLVVVGGDGLWNVHVHVDDVGAALEAGIAAGHPHRIRVTHLADAASTGAAPRTGRRVVAFAAGDGLAELFREAGATVVRTGPGQRPTAREVLDVVLDTGAEEVVLLPNDDASLASAEAAAQMARADQHVRVAVIRTVTQVQGLAALAVHEPGRSYETDVMEMTAAAGHARSGAVTIARAEAMTSAGRCRLGDVLGVVEGDFVVVGTDLFDVATEVLDRLLGGGGEMVTLVTGAEAEDGPAAGLARRCTERLMQTRPGVDVVVYEGGQAGYPLLVGVE